jgi:MFS family permease
MNTKKQHISQGIKVVTLARSIRWFGWGMCETLIPVLLFSFSHSYVEAGIFRSIYDVIFLLSLPFVSVLADKIPAKRLILFALALYPLIGVSYFVAGAVGTAFFIVLARAVNGITWCCDSVGGDTYLRRFAINEHLSKTFGYLSALPNFSWMIAALISILFLPFLPIQYLFLAIVPTSLIAYFVLKQAPSDEVPLREKPPQQYLKDLTDSFKGIRSWKMEIWGLAYLTFFVACIDLLGTFFVPLFTYTESNNLVHVVLITVAFATPSAFAFYFGAFIDRVSKGVFITGSFLLAAILFGGLSFTSGYILQIIGVFILGMLIVCVTLAVQTLVTKASSREHYGKVGGLMAGADELGAVIGPIAIGFLADGSGMHITFLILGAFALITALGFFFCISNSDILRA